VPIVLPFAEHSGYPCTISSPIYPHILFCFFKSISSISLFNLPCILISLYDSCLTETGEERPGANQLVYDVRLAHVNNGRIRVNQFGCEFRERLCCCDLQFVALDFNRVDLKCVLNGCTFGQCALKRCLNGFTGHRLAVAPAAAPFYSR